MHKTRGSNAVRELVCAGAIGYDGPSIKHHAPEAEIGTAVDWCMGEYVQGRTPDLDKVARDYGVDRSLLGSAYHGGVKVWGRIGHWFPKPTTQRRIEGSVTCGTADLVAIVGESILVLLVLDWKLGLSTDLHTAQLMAYALGIYDEYLDHFGLSENLNLIQKAVLVEVHLIPAQWHVTKVSVEGLEIFRDQLKRQHAQAGYQYAPGDWCKYCPMNSGCWARNEWLAEASLALTGVQSGGLTDKATLAELWDKSKALKKALAAYDAAVKVSLQDGPLDLGDGRRLELEESEKIVIDSEIAAGVLGEFGLELTHAMSTSKSAIAKAVKVHADVEKVKGVKINQAAMVRQVMGHIDVGGGLEKKTTTSIKVRR